MINLTTPPPLSLYIHVPWCVRKCPYCDFNSHKSPDSLPERQYVDALLLDLDHELEDIASRPIETIFIGGGTPSLFSAEAYNRLFEGIKSRSNLLSSAEITLEANPGTFEAQRFADYRSLGINRLSIGVQSFNNDALSALGRIHDSQQAIKAIETAHKVGFDNFNLDLMFGLPNQTEKLAQNDIEMALALEPTHFSYYQLTMEPNTLFHRKPPPLPIEDDIIDWQINSQQRLAQAGFSQYEVSAYAKDNLRCKHNVNYWQFGDYIGIGAGAHGKITRIDEQTIIRRSKQKHPQAYLDHSGKSSLVQTHDVITEADLNFEFMLNALRLTNGFDSTLYQRHTGQTLSSINPTLAKAMQLDLIEKRDQMIIPTEKGQRYLNTLIELFLPE